MERSLYLILASLFFSSLADNALLIVAISSLHDMHAPAWMTPALREVFIVSYVVLGAFAGPVSDAFPKARVMFCCGVVKIAGCLAMLHGMHPLPAYCIVGLGTCFYAPAKFGLITENAAILLVLGGYSILVKEGAGFDTTSSALGAILAAGTGIIVWRSRQALAPH